MKSPFTIITLAALLSTVYSIPLEAAGTSSSTGTAAGATSTNNSANPMATTGNSSVNTTTSSNWDSQNSYWRNNYISRPYYNSTRDYSLYEPAYRYGYDMYSRNSGKTYNDLSQEELRRGWEQARGNSNLNWNDAQMATRDSYNRLYDTRNNPISANTNR